MMIFTVFTVLRRFGGEVQGHTHRLQLKQCAGVSVVCFCLFLGTSQMINDGNKD